MDAAEDFPKVSSGQIEPSDEVQGQPGLDPGALRDGRGPGPDPGGRLGAGPDPGGRLGARAGPWGTAKGQGWTLGPWGTAEGQGWTLGDARRNREREAMLEGEEVRGFRVVVQGERERRRGAKKVLSTVPLKAADGKKKKVILTARGIKPLPPSKHPSLPLQDPSTPPPLTE